MNRIKPLPITQTLKTVFDNVLLEHVGVIGLNPEAFSIIFHIQGLQYVLTQTAYIA